MEPAKIDWKRIDSRFEEDCVYEHINAPKWVDFLNPLLNDSPDDVAWFCRPDCNHPKSVEDFLNKMPNSTMVRSSAGGNDAPSSHPYSTLLRDPNLKRRGQGKHKEHLENLDPSMSTPPPSRPANPTTMAAAFKSSSEKRKPRDDNNLLPRKEETQPPLLRTTLSARNLFAGRDILNHITEFCNELKKLATRPKQKETNEEKMKDKRKKNNQEGTMQGSGAVLRDLNDKQRNSSTVEDVKFGKVLENQSQKKLSEEAENVPPSMNLENARRKGGEQLLQIRTNPPSPQCFSAPPGSSIKTTTPPPKASQQSRLADRGVLQELKPIKSVNGKAESATVAAGREAGGALDMFWCQIRLRLNSSPFFHSYTTCETFEFLHSFSIHIEKDLHKRKGR